MTGTKIDTIKIRQLNREQTFEYIKKNPMAARADVAKELNLSFPTVTSIVTELEEAGLIRAEKSTTNTGGRSSMAYSCDENARCAIGIQLSVDLFLCRMMSIMGIITGPLRSDICVLKKMEDVVIAVIMDVLMRIAIH